MTQTSKKVGDFLEELVLRLHQVAGNAGTTKAQLSAIDGSGRKREIDVLIEISAGKDSPIPSEFPAFVPVECKSYKDPVGIQLIDAYFGMLHDVGLPTEGALFVSVNGYTKDARERAASAGIQTLRLGDLTPDRLAIAVREALHTLIFWVAEWDLTQHFRFVPGNTPPEGAICCEWPVDVSPPKHEHDVHMHMLTEVWKSWSTGQIPLEVGEVRFFGRLPGNAAAICDVRVSAHTVDLVGEVQSVHLAPDKAPKGHERLFVEGTRIRLPDGAVSLRQVADESRLGTGKYRRVDVRAPRIIGGKVYWPPSSDAFKKIQMLMAANKSISFESVEGLNLWRAWLA